MSLQIDYADRRNEAAQLVNPVILDQAKLDELMATAGVDRDRPDKLIIRLSDWSPQRGGGTIQGRCRIQGRTDGGIVLVVKVFVVGKATYSQAATQQVNSTLMHELRHVAQFQALKLEEVSQADDEFYITENQADALEADAENFTTLLRHDMELWPLSFMADAEEPS